MERLPTMSAASGKWIAGLVCGWALAASTPAAGRRLFVEPFATKTSPDKLRRYVISELSKFPSVSLVDGKSGADEILGGGGEIWVKGYRSLNPRSGRLPSDGTPIYGGYLSVELRNPDGEVVWSYLATPGNDGGDISKDLAKRIAKHVAAALEEAPAPPRAALPAQPAIAIHGAGATFPYPVYSKWLTNYRRENPAVDISYEPVGSEAGIRRLLEGKVDFGASDNPQALREISPENESRYLFFPSVAGAVVPIVNLPGVTSDVSFTPEALAGIYLGKITKWNDPVLRQSNRGVNLPDLDIVVVYRGDGSGTSYAFTDFLWKAVPEWKAEVGSGLNPKWPVGRGASGNEGVANLVKEMGGSIGYVEYIYALEHHLSFGKVRNQAGEFVTASLESIAAAVSHAAPAGEDFKISVVNAPGAESYPIASFTWLVVPAHIADGARRQALAAFLRWMLGPGQAQSAALGYLALPKELVARELAAIGGLH
ncbi:MAG TPA: phosphate ABC transporter substrate-binding protein PstS [Bryobacteraceae bacterium]|nr:phosphate ABC transporter substrate-binding protein PstS [Bryobacteraceae bacterium]